MADYDYGSDDYLGFYAPPTTDFSDYGFGDGNYVMPPSDDYGNEGRNYPTPESTQGPGGSPVNATTYSSMPSWLRNALGKAFSGNSGGPGMTTGQGILGLLAALAGSQQRARPSGGGSSQGYAGPKDPGRTVVAGKYGPQASYTTPPVRAATGGPLYAQGGPVQLEHGGFVMTKRAVDGAGGPQGIAQVAPGAQMLRGPGTGTSDSIPAQINGPRGQTPALVSNGEAYVPRQAVQSAGGIPRLMATMKQLERKA